MVNFKKWIKFWAWLLSMGLALGLYILSSISNILGNISLASINMLQSVIQAEATILGFFAIIGAYGLTSYDTRIDRHEQQLFDLHLSEVSPVYKQFEKKLNDLKEKKRGFAKLCAVIASLLIISLLFSTITLGMKDASSSLAKIFSGTALYLFFIGIIGIVYFFVRISRET